jgi:enamine deaminase RidA (YjgF/YER057c/UK114 family)
MSSLSRLGGVAGKWSWSRTVTDVVRINYILPRREDSEPCWPVLKSYFGEIRPASTMIVAGLADPRMRIEIEVSARRR